MIRSIGIVLLVVGVTAMPGCARTEAPAGIYHYGITHPSFGDIGVFTNVITRDGDRVIVATTLEVKVSLLFFVVHRVEAERTQIWRGGRLIGYESRTVRNGEEIRVRGRAVGDAFVIEWPRGRVLLPPDVFPTNPWSIQITRATSVMASENGELRNLWVIEGAKQRLEIKGEPRTARHFRVRGDMEQDIWYDDNDVPVKFIHSMGEDRVTFTLL